jgi:hypothetical protein
MTKTLGVQDIVTLASALGDLATIVDNVAIHGQVGWLDLPKLIPAANAIREFASVNYAELLPEYEALTPDETATVVAAFDQHLAISEITGKAAIEAGFAAMLKASGAIQELKDVLAAAWLRRLTAEVRWLRTRVLARH